MLARVAASRSALTYQAYDKSMKSCDELITFITQAAGTCIHLVKIKGTCRLQLIGHFKLCPGLNIPVYVQVAILLLLLHMCVNSETSFCHVYVVDLTAVRLYSVLLRK